jgi:hypothetical protein
MHLLTGSYITMILYVVVGRQRHTIFGVGVVMAVWVANTALDEVMG